MLPGEAKCGKDGDMPHGNGHTSHNMYARDMVYISKYWHCQFESIDMQTMSLACILSETWLFLWGMLPGEAKCGMEVTHGWRWGGLYLLFHLVNSDHWKVLGISI